MAVVTQEEQEQEEEDRISDICAIYPRCLIAQMVPP